MTLQARASGLSETTFGAGDCDGLILGTVIRKFVFEPLAQELGEAVGAVRSEGWVWLRTDRSGIESSGDLSSDNVYCIHSDGTFVANPSDLAEIERDGINGRPCERLSGAALERKRQNWIRLLFERDNAEDCAGLDPITANFVGVHREDFIWSTQLVVEDVLPAFHSLGELAERPLGVDNTALTAIRQVARKVTKRWHHLIELLRLGELIAMGFRKHRRERLSLELWSNQATCIDVQSGMVGKSKSELIAAIDELDASGPPSYRAGNNRGRALHAVWSDSRLWVSEKDCAASMMTTSQAARIEPAQTGIAPENASFEQPDPLPPVTPPPTKTAEDRTTSQRKRKQKDAPIKGPIRAVIMDALKKGKTTIEELSNLPHKTLMDRYGGGAGRTTVVDAMKGACRDFQSRQIPTNDK